MKKISAVVAAVALAIPGIAMARGNHPLAGCGLGYVLLGHKDNTQVNQILAGTTNATSANQTFGITSGTSGCTEDGAVKFVKEAEVFAEVNLDSLKKEMASGQGDYVNSFASLLGAQEAEIPAMVQLFKNNYATLFPSASTTSDEMLASLATILNS